MIPVGVPEISLRWIRQFAGTAKTVCLFGAITIGKAYADDNRGKIETNYKARFSFTLYTSLHSVHCVFNDFRVFRVTFWKMLHDAHEQIGTKCTCMKESLADVIYMMKFVFYDSFSLSLLFTFN